MIKQGCILYHDHGPLLINKEQFIPLSDFTVLVENEAAEYNVDEHLVSDEIQEERETEEADYFNMDTFISR